MSQIAPKFYANDRVVCTSKIHRKELDGLRGIVVEVVPLEIVHTNGQTETTGYYYVLCLLETDGSVSQDGTVGVNAVLVLDDEIQKVEEK